MSAEQLSSGGPNHDHKDEIKLVDDNIIAENDVKTEAVLDLPPAEAGETIKPRDEAPPARSSGSEAESIAQEQEKEVLTVTETSEAVEKAVDEPAAPNVAGEVEKVEQASADQLEDKPDPPAKEDAEKPVPAPKDEPEVVDERTAIQNAAIEHLARRASSMNLDSGAQPPTTVHRDAKLPAAPPPPPVPAKIAPDVPEKHVPASETVVEEAGAQDLPEALQGVSEPTGEEIQHIIDQFQAEDTAMGEEEIMSPRLERQQPVLQLPPRTSSLGERTPAADSIREHYFAGNTASSRNSVISISTQPATAGDDTASITSHRTSIFQPPPPSPDPEPALPFDFHRFLEQLRHRTADPVARFLRSFLQEFGKKQWMVHEQVKIIGDFLEFISKKMSQCEVWRSVSDAEFDNAREGMEKLVMNRLYTQTFSPAIPPPSGSPRKGKNARAADVANQTGLGRKGQHQEDVERDEVIAQKIRIYGWIKEEHLDIKPIGDKGKKFLAMAQQELIKLNTYRAPRDKVICVLNCCKVIFGFLKNSKGDQSADSFVPLLIYTVLRARPEHLVSNVQYIWRFRNQEKLGGEAGYYMSSLMGVVTFLENLDRTMLTISDEDFEKNVEQAVSAIAEGHQAGEYEQKSHTIPSASNSNAPSMQHLSEKAAISRPEVTPRNSAEVQQSSPRRMPSSRTNTRPTASTEDDTDAVTGLLRTIQKPLSSIGRIFSDESAPQRAQQEGLRPGSTPLPPRTSSRGLSPAARIERSSSQAGYPADQERQRMQAQEAAVRQASVESAEQQRERQRGFAVVVETLQGMFPNLEKEIIEDVVRAQEGNVQRAVDACLALSGQT